MQYVRARPKITSDNRRILQPVFDGQPFKELFIPRAIDDYNHHMKGVDQANQLRASFTCHRRQNYREAEEVKEAEEVESTTNIDEYQLKRAFFLLLSFD
jgi:hypothetical protein